MKYMGSKARLANKILPIILSNKYEGQYYVEPFCGGCNLIDKVIGRRLASDSNNNLIAMWEAIVYKDWIPQTITKEFYNDVKREPQNYPPHLVGWVGFNCSYSGKYFGGFAGKVLVKTGKIRDYQDEAMRNVLKQRDKLKGVKFSNGTYNDMSIPPNSLIYCDPPYKGTTDYSDKFNHVDFWNWVLLKRDEGHTIYVSEYTAPEQFECVWSTPVQSSLSITKLGGVSKCSIEKLFHPL